MEYTLTTYKQIRGTIYETSDGHKYIFSKRMVAYNYLRFVFCFVTVVNLLLNWTMIRIW